MNLKHSGLAIGYYIWLNQFLDTTGHCSQQSSVSSPEAEGTIALLQKVIRLLKLNRRNVICFLSSSQEKHSVCPWQGSIPSFTWKRESLLWLLWRFSRFLLTSWVCARSPVLFKRLSEFKERNAMGTLSAAGFLLLFFYLFTFSYIFYRLRKKLNLWLWAYFDFEKQQLFIHDDDDFSLTHCTSCVSSTLGNMMARGRTLAFKITSRSASAKPLDTEFTLTHFSVRPRSNSASILGIVSLASVCERNHNLNMQHIVVLK